LPVESILLRHLFFLLGLLAILKKLRAYNIKGKTNLILKHARTVQVGNNPKLNNEKESYKMIRILTNDFKYKANSFFGKMMMIISLRITTNYIISLISIKTKLKFNSVAILLSFFPLIAICAEYIINDYSFQDLEKLCIIGWAIYYSIYNYCLFKLNRYAWNKFIDTTDEIALLVGEKQQNILVDFLYKHIRPSFQIFLGITTGIAGLSLLFIASFQLSDCITFMVTNYLHIFLISFIMGNSYFMLCVSVYMNYKIYKFDKLNVFTFNPLDTPGLQKLSKLMTTFIFIAFFCAVFVEIPPLVYILIIPSKYDYLPVVVMSTISIVTLLVIGFFPQALITLIIRRHKKNALSKLQAWLSKNTSFDYTVKSTDSQHFIRLCGSFDLYKELKDIKICKVGLISIFRYAFFLLCSFLPWILTKIIDG